MIDEDEKEQAKREHYVDELQRRLESGERVKVGGCEYTALDAFDCDESIMHLYLNAVAHFMGNRPDHDGQTLKELIRSHLYCLALVLVDKYMEDLKDD